MPTRSRMRSLEQDRERAAHCSIRKSPFGECFVRDWAQTGVEKGVGRGPKHSTKECGGAGAVAHGGTGWPRMVGGAVFAACGDGQAGVATGAAPRLGPVAALSAERGGYGPAAGASPGTDFSATPPPDLDPRGAPGLERQDDPAYPDASQDLYNLGAHARALS